MSWFDGDSASDGAGLQPQTQENWKPAKAPFFLLWVFMGINFTLVALSWIFRPQSLDSAIFLAMYWLASFLLMIVGYYVFSIQTHKQKLSPDYSTPQSSERLNRLTFLTVSFLLTCLAAYPLAYELSRLVRL